MKKDTYRLHVFRINIRNCSVLGSPTDIELVGVLLSELIARRLDGYTCHRETSICCLHMYGRGAVLPNARVRICLALDIIFFIGQYDTRIHRIKHIYHKLAKQFTIPISFSVLAYTCKT